MIDDTHDLTSTLGEVSRGLDELESLLADESRSAGERAIGGRKAFSEIDLAVRAARAKGLTADDPAFAPLQERGRAVMARLRSLADQAQAEIEARAGVPDGEAMGRSAAGIEERCYERMFEILAERDGAVVDLEAARDRHIREMVGAGSQRDFFLGGRSRDAYERGLAAGLAGRPEELRSRLLEEIATRYRNRPEGAILEEVVSLSRFLERKRLADPDRAHLERLGILTGISDGSRAKLGEADARLDAVLAGLADESRPAAERGAEALEAGAEIRDFLMTVLAEGLAYSQPAVAALRAKSQRIGARLVELSGR